MVKKDKRPYVMLDVQVWGVSGTPLEIAAQFKSLVRHAIEHDMLGKDATVEIVEHDGPCDPATCGNDEAHLSHAETPAGL